MYRVLNDDQLDTAITSFVSRKFDKFDIPVMPSQAKNGIQSRITESSSLLRDCVTAAGYLIGRNSSFAK